MSDLSDSNDARSRGTLTAGRRMLLIFIVVIIGGVAFALLRNNADNRALAADMARRQETIVNVVTASADKTANAIELSATITAFNEAPILARTSGYVRRWNVEMGARVTAGTVLLDIEAPELDQELAQAKATTAQAHASLDVARLTAARWQELRKTDAVSQQETDDRTSAATQLESAAKAADANVNRLQQLAQFQHVTAPFSGIIVKRSVEIGQLVTAGAGTPLYVLQQTDPVRLFVNVAQADSAQIKTGSSASIEVAEHPGHIFAGKVTRMAGALDPQTRTRLTEIDVPNSDGSLSPGSYARVKLANTRIARGLLIPNTALLFREEGPRMAVVTANGTVTLREVSLGDDNGKSVEVLSGIAPGDRVITNPPDALRDGDTVVVAKK